VRGYYAATSMAAVLVLQQQQQTVTRVMAVSLLVWLFLLVVIAGVICLRVYLRQTVYCPVADRLDNKTILITGTRPYQSVNQST